MKKVLMTLALLTLSGTVLAVDPPPYVLINPHDGETCYRSDAPELDPLVAVSATNMIANMMEAYWGFVHGSAANEYWYRLVRQDMTMEEVALELVNHRYFIRPPFDKFVGNTYHALLLREPDCRGFDWWLANHSSDDYAAVVAGFIWSDEFASLARQLRIRTHH